MKRFFLILTTVLFMGIPLVAEAARPPDCSYNYGNGCVAYGWNHENSESSFFRVYCDGEQVWSGYGPQGSC